MTASAWAANGQPDASASALLTGDYAFTVTGGSGDGFAEPLLTIWGANGGNVEWASASLGGCEVSLGGPLQCLWASVPFEFDVPQTLALFLHAGASVSPYGGATGEASVGGFAFFYTNGD
ncbi:MAG: hypothetical protein WA459_21425, partial [Stellaceae bacterium]